MMLARCLPILLTVSISVLAEPAATASSRAPSRVNVTGDYSSNWDDVRLVQDGDRVRGTYVCCGGGTIEGRIIEGRVIRYRWEQPNGAGEGIWEITPSRRLEGTWGHGKDDDDGGAWTLAPKSPQIAN